MSCLGNILNRQVPKGVRLWRLCLVVVSNVLTQLRWAPLLLLSVCVCVPSKNSPAILKAWSVQVTRYQVGTHQWCGTPQQGPSDGWRALFGFRSLRTTKLIGDCRCCPCEQLPAPAGTKAQLNQFRFPVQLALLQGSSKALDFPSLKLAAVVVLVHTCAPCRLMPNLLKLALKPRASPLGRMSRDAHRTALPVINWGLQSITAR